MSKLQPAPGRRQAGIAIVTAMLVVALGSITMVSIAARQQLTLQRERNEGAILLARDLAVSGERFAAALLFRDREAGDRNNTDSLDDDWAQTIPPVPIDENAAIQGCVWDLQGRLNLNNLVDADGNAIAYEVERMQRLFGELGIAVNKVQAVLDWVDRDFNATVPDGAEDAYYTGLDPAYRAANAPFVSPSELKLVKGFSPAVEEEAEDYALLLPHVTALPTVNGPLPINVNTATPEVLASLSDDMKGLAGDLSRWDSSAYEDYPECENIFDLAAEGPESLSGDARDTTPFESTLLFDDEADPGGGNGLDLGIEGSRDVRSDFFQLRIDVITETVRVSQFTVLERDGEGRTRVLYRSRDTP